MNGTDIFLIAGISLALILAIGKCIRDHKQGKSCGCGCAQCSQNCGKRK